MKFQSDIDIDFGNRDDILKLIKHTSARIDKDGKSSKHNTGIYVTSIPNDPLYNMSNIDYKEAEARGYVKLDFLNVGLYQQVHDEKHLEGLLKTAPDWARFNADQAFFEQLIHVNNHWNVLKKMPEPVDTIPRLAMLLSVIRPAKRHLIGMTWTEVAESVWARPNDDSYYFKKSHAVAYAHLVVVNMNLLSLADKNN